MHCLGFMLFGIIHSGIGLNAIYFNTNNPNRDFPLKIHDFEIISELSEILVCLLDLSDFNIGFA